jgi:hypothetical protein
MDWDAHRQWSRERRAGNRRNSADILRERGVDFVTRNDGAHLIVQFGTATADFWPGTGKYRVRPDGKYLRGVFNLLKDLGVDDV